MTQAQEYPSNASGYELTVQIGRGSSAVVWKGTVKDTGQAVAIKIIDLEKIRGSLDELLKEIKMMTMSNHPNIVKLYASFINKSTLWIVQSLLDISYLDLMKLRFPHGLDEQCVATILRGTLEALRYLHEQGLIHRDIKAGNILLDSEGQVFVGDFGVSAHMIENGERRDYRSTFVGTPCWMAPEVIGQKSGYNYKADIWSVGIMTMELVRGQAPYSNLDPMRVLVKVLEGPAPSLPEEDSNSDSSSDWDGRRSGKSKQYSREIRQFVSLCLNRDPQKRPSAKELLEHSFIRRYAKGPAVVKSRLMENLPSIEERSKLNAARGILDGVELRPPKSNSSEMEHALLNSMPPPKDASNVARIAEKGKSGGWNFDGLDSLPRDSELGKAIRETLIDGDSEDERLQVPKSVSNPFKLASGNVVQSGGEKSERDIADGEGKKTNQQQQLQRSQNPGKGEISEVKNDPAQGAQSVRVGRFQVMALDGADSRCQTPNSTSLATPSNDRPFGSDDQKPQEKKTDHGISSESPHSHTTTAPPSLSTASNLPQPSFSTQKQEQHGRFEVSHVHVSKSTPTMTSQNGVPNASLSAWSSSQGLGTGAGGSHSGNRSGQAQMGRDPRTMMNLVAFSLDQMNQDIVELYKENRMLREKLKQVGGNIELPARYQLLSREYTVDKERKEEVKRKEREKEKEKSKAKQNERQQTQPFVD
ncbi:putative serine/threonine protein kinase [Blattamonas nauphoetae]|uniref:Serine/threonine protein kinase n=1 Tax=Blattamonas nauphoetae TaxID=2049346 RepID=A0ABQ9Y6Y7_9EUKA|nr:putative serine/threonine protein kinase [Blattamonas nauphoetae]